MRYLIPLLLLFCTLTGLQTHIRADRTVNFFNWDAYSYHLYLPATVVYGTPFRYDFAAAHFKNYPVSSGVYQYQTVGDRQTPFFTMGAALCEAPFFLVAYALNRAVLTAYPVDGMSLPYQVGGFVASLFYFGLGLVCLRRVLAPRFGERATAITLIAIALGTNLLQYVVFEPGLSHTYLFGGYALLLYLTDRWHDRPGIGTAAALGVVLGLLCLIRPSELIAVLIPVLYGVHNRAALSEKIRLLVAQWPGVLAALFAAVVVIFPQMLWWKIATGQWVYNAYAVRGDFFDFSKPHLLDGLFSYRKGWLLYTPIMAFALAGFVPLYRRHREWFWPVLSYAALNFFVLMSYHMWWFASCFGNRALVQSYAALALPLAAFSVYAFRGRWLKITLFSAIFVFLTALNLFQHWQYRVGLLPTDNITRNFYWRVFGETRPDRSLRKYIDLKAYLRGAERGPHTLVEGFEFKDSIGHTGHFEYIGGLWGQTTPRDAYSQGVVVEFDADRAAALRGRWLWIEATLFSRGDLFSPEAQARLVASVDQKGVSAIWHGLQFQSYYPENAWNVVAFELKMPDDLQAGDLLKTYVWNQGPDAIFVNKIYVSKIER
jgi:hypothetical protein